jgi:hypothetical protein
VGRQFRIGRYDVEEEQVECKSKRLPNRSTSGCTNKEDGVLIRSTGCANINMSLFRIILIIFS